MRELQKDFSRTVKLSEVKADEFDTVFYTGRSRSRCGILLKVPTPRDLLESFYSAGKPIALVCHSPGVLRHVTYKGEPLVKGKHVTGFTDGEEEEMQLTGVVPFLVEDELLKAGSRSLKRSATGIPSRSSMVVSLRAESRRLPPRQLRPC